MYVYMYMCIKVPKSFQAVSRPLYLIGYVYNFTHAIHQLYKQPYHQCTFMSTIIYVYVHVHVGGAIHIDTSVDPTLLSENVFIPPMYMYI